MGWYGKGEERVRHFRLYRELEAKHVQSQKDAAQAVKLLEDRVTELTAVIKKKDDLIKRLAQELHTAFSERLPQNAYERSGAFQRKLTEALEAEEKASGLDRVAEAAGPSVPRSQSGFMRKIS